MLLGILPKPNLYVNKSTKLNAASSVVKVMARNKIVVGITDHYQLLMTR